PDDGVQADGIGSEEVAAAERLAAVSQGDHRGAGCRWGGTKPRRLNTPSSPTFYNCSLRGVLLSVLKDTLFQGQPLPEDLTKALPPARSQQVIDGVKALRGEPSATPDRTLKAHSEAWLERQQALAAACQMTPARAANNRTCLTHFLTFLGPD